MQSLEHEQASSLAMNDIGRVEMETLRPIFFDPYRQNRITGSFILIDAETNATAAAGMIEGLAAGGNAQATLERASAVHSSAVILVQGDGLVSALESTLLDAGCSVVRTRRHDSGLWRGLLGLGVITLVEGDARRQGSDGRSNGESTGAQLAIFSPDASRGGRSGIAGSPSDAEPHFEALLPAEQASASDVERAAEIARRLRQKTILRSQAAEGHA
jgi:hypothetical protein